MTSWCPIQPKVACQPALRQRRCLIGGGSHAWVPTPRAPRQLKVPRHAVVAAAADSDSTVLLATYAGLGLAAASFVATFFVAPRFRDSFKEPLEWKKIYAELVAQGGVRTVSAREAYGKTRKGGVLLDVRLVNKYEQSHPEGAVSVPLYNPIQSWDVASNIRRAGFAFFGIYGTELNRSFAEDALQVVPKNKDVYVICEMGGSLDNKPGVSNGFQSRSLKAIYLLRLAGYKRLYHVKGGLIDWGVQGLPMEEGGGEGQPPSPPPPGMKAEAAAREGVLAGLLSRR